MNAAPFSLGVRILGAGAALLLLFLGVGFALPGTWSAERTQVLASPPSALFPILERPSAWRAFTAWPDTGLVVSGPEAGAGARLSWDNRDVGNGTFEIVEATPSTRVRYHVQVQDGAMRTDGTLTLVPEGAGTRLTWREEGDFGWNPLMGYWARFMERAQGRELEKALARLEASAATPRNDAAPAGR